MGGRVGAGARDVETTVLDIVSPFLRIVAPPIRPANFELMTGRERADVESLVGVLVSCSATFRPVQRDFGARLQDTWDARYRLDP